MILSLDEFYPSDCPRSGNTQIKSEILIKKRLNSAHKLINPGPRLSPCSIPLPAIETGHLPLDPGDSKPLRYLPAKRAVYSINRNGDLKDDGGDPKNDTVLRLDWDQE